MWVVLVKSPTAQIPVVYGPWCEDEHQSPQEWIDERYDEEEKEFYEIKIAFVQPR